MSVSAKIFNCIYYANGIWVAAGTDSIGLCYSTDGTLWFKSDIASGYFNCVYYANGTWVAAGSGLYYSTDGKTWTQSNITSDNIYCIYYDNGIWVVGSDSNKGLYYSTDIGKVLIVDSNAKVKAGELTISELTSISRPFASNAGKVLMADNSGNAVWTEPPQSGAAVQILTWEATD